MQISHLLFADSKSLYNLLEVWKGKIKYKRLFNEFYKESFLPLL